MAEELYKEPCRGPLDVAHFTFAFIGFLAAVGGVIIVSASLAIIGVLILAWGLSYFAAN